MIYYFYLLNMDPTLAFSHHAEVGKVANVSGTYGASTFERLATLPLPHGENIREQD
jgi:hypothetical protein